MGYEQASRGESHKLDSMIKAVMAANPIVVINLAQHQGCDIKARDFWPNIHTGFVMALYAIRAGDIDMDEVSEILG